MFENYIGEDKSLPDDISALSGSAESYRGEPAWCEAGSPSTSARCCERCPDSLPGQSWCMGLILCFFMGPPPPGLTPSPDRRRGRAPAVFSPLAGNFGA